MIDDAGRLLASLKTPTLGKEYDLQTMAAFLKRTDVCLQRDSPISFETRAAIEKAGAFPGQGVVAMFTFGFGWGLWHGMMAVLGIPFEIVLPRQWQALVPGIQGLTKAERKKLVIAWARRLWPTIPNHSGICEAAAMAEWLRRREVGA